MAVLLPGILESSSTWLHLRRTVLADYILGSLILLAGAGGGAFLLGTTLAWVMSRYSIPFRSFFEIALLLPHAMPVYISAFGYRGLVSYGGLLHPLFREFSGPGAAIFVMTFGFYTYVYLACRAMLGTFGGQFIDSARAVGIGEWQLFARVALPLMRPAAFAGTVIVGIEVLNEFGALTYLGVESLTTGIFRAWFAFGDLTAAVKLSLIMLAAVALLITAERLLRGRASFAASGSGPAPVSRRKPSRSVTLILMIFLSIPILLGFILPGLQLLLWAGTGNSAAHADRLVEITVNTLLLSGFAGLAGVGAALLIGFLPLLFRRGIGRVLAEAPGLGYVVPGAIIAIGIMRITVPLDSWLNDLHFHFFNSTLGLILTGNLAILTAAYCIRYFAVAYRPIDSAYTSLGSLHIDTAAGLGRSPLYVFLRVYLPQLRQAAFFGGILFLLDVIKELPLTMILRPFNFSTLATATYALAADERLNEAAPYGLVLVAIGGGITVLFMMISSLQNYRRRKQ
jgi:iron(III) transport system permease protein